MVLSTNTTTVKFVCSYGGRILPRYTDGKLRYHGGHTRVLAVHRSIPFSELMMKLAEMCGSPVSLRCQLPTEDLDALVSITSDEDLANLIEEYDRISAMAPPPPPPLKIRAFLYPPKSAARKSPVSPPSPTASASEPSSSSSSLSSSYSSASSPRSAAPAKPPLPPSPPRVAAPKIPYHGCYVYRNPSHIYLIHNGVHWQ